MAGAHAASSCSARFLSASACSRAVTAKNVLKRSSTCASTNGHSRRARQRRPRAEYREYERRGLSAYSVQCRPTQRSGCSARRRRHCRGNLEYSRGAHGRPLRRTARGRRIESPLPAVRRGEARFALLGCCSAGLLQGYPEYCRGTLGYSGVLLESPLPAVRRGEARSALLACCSAGLLQGYPEYCRGTARGLSGRAPMGSFAVL